MTAITPFKVTQGHRLWCHSKARMQLRISKLENVAIAIALQLEAARNHASPFPL